MRVGTVGTLLSALAGLLLIAPPARAQQLQSIRLSETNGQIDFWLPAPRRPDTDFTNGTSLDAVFDGTLLWGRLLSSQPTPCSAASSGASGAGRCATTEFVLGQDIYTPPSSTLRAAPQLGARPYAGWLYLASTARMSTASRLDAVTIEVGATGTPSLAEKVQTAWHSLIGYPRPLGWSHQIPFKPGILVAYEHRQELLHASIANVPVASLVPHGRISVGNVLAGASAGVDGRIGYGLTTPWTTGAQMPARKLEVFAEANIREDFVAYELFLDRGTTRPTRFVQKQPWVTQYEFGGGIRWGSAEIEYRASVRGQDYVTGRRTQPLATLALGLRY